MKIEIIENKECIKRVSIEIPWLEIDQKASDIAKNFQRSARLDGFRPGKAPISHIKRLFAKDIKNEILNEVVPKSINDFIEQEHLHLAADPEVKELIYAEQCPLTYIIEFEVIPHFELKPYLGIQIKKENIIVADNEINEKISELQRKEAHLLPVDNRPAQMDDYVHVFFKLPKELITSNSPDSFDSYFIVGAPEVLVELNNAVIGLELNKHKEFEFELEPDNVLGEQAKRKMVMELELKEIKELKVPPVEEIMKVAIQNEDIKEFKNKIRKDLLEEKQKQEQEYLKDRIIEKLVQAYQFEVPPSIVKNQYNYLQRRWKEQLAMKSSITLPTALLRATEKRKELMEKARQDIISSLVLEAIAKDKSIEIHEQEITARLEQLARDTGMNPVVLKSKLEASGDYDQLVTNMKREATLDFLLQHAKII
jgi:trigger factor